MAKRSFKGECSGQVLIVSALLVSLLLLSTALYVIDVGKQVPIINAGNDIDFSLFQQSTRNTLISALANVTGGGNRDVLDADLAELKEIILSNSYQAMLTVDYSMLNSSGYQNGFWISWGADGKGISSAYTSFVFRSSSTSATSNLEYAANVTSTLNLSGTYHQLNETTKQVSLTINVLNDGKAALAPDLSISYQNQTDWAKVDSPNVTSFGNGTYAVSFAAETLQPTDPLIVSLLCMDSRGIFIGANVTCINV